MCAFSEPLSGYLGGSSYLGGGGKVVRKPIHLFAWVHLLCVKGPYSQWETEKNKILANRKCSTAHIENMIGSLDKLVARNII
jgi:hypothetical protein